MADKKTENENKFTKQELVRSNRFIDYVDVLTAILDKNKSYTIEETEKMIDKFMKGKVN